MAPVTRSPAFQSIDLEVVKELADRTALAVAGALLLADRERAHEEAMAAAGRMARLETLTAALGSTISLREVGAVIARESKEALGADRAAVYEVLPAEGLAKRIAASGYLHEQLAPCPEMSVDAEHPLPLRVATRNVTVPGSGSSDALPEPPFEDERAVRPYLFAAAPLKTLVRRLLSIAMLVTIDISGLARLLGPPRAIGG